MSNVPTWLYRKDGHAEIIRDQAVYEQRIAEGWKDSPARFSEEALAAEKEAAEKEAAEKEAAEKEAAAKQSPTVPPPVKKKPAKVVNKKDSSADDLI